MIVPLKFSVCLSAMMTNLFIATNIILWGCIAFLLYSLIKTKKHNRILEQTLRIKREKKDTEIVNKIRLSKKQLETSFDAITDFLCVIDMDFKILRANKSYADFVHLPIRDIIGRPCYEIFWKRSSVCERCPARQTLATGFTVTKQHFNLRTVDGIRHFDIGTFPVIGVDEKTENVIEQIRDVTEEKSVLEQLIRSEKLATIGTMTAGIAHEMINPLSGISGTVTNMLNSPQKYGLNEKGKQRLSTLMDAVARATMIMKDLLHLSRKEDATTVLTDINTVVVKAVNAVQMKGFPQIEYKLLLEKSLTRVLCDPLKIEQVIINMVTNAVQSIMEKNEAMALQGTKHNGLIIISTQIVDEMVHIDIIDNGMGISDEIRGKIFDPFFTTRSPGEGTGLGLSVCHRIIEEHNGSIRVESSNGLTTFTIYLPAQPQTAAIVL
jgi:PAS domain S-box-containing protein